VTLLEAESAGLPALGASGSALYEGTVSHHRFGPGPNHHFSNTIAMPLLDLAEVDAVLGRHPLWSTKAARPGRFRRADFLGDPSVSLDQAVRDLCQAQSGQRPEGAIMLLANLRMWGWVFNPISLYYCTDERGGDVTQTVLDVQNTPWHERCTYVVGPPGRHRFAKAMHVSPFLPMDVEYELRYTQPHERLVVSLDLGRGNERLLGATMSLTRRPLDRSGLSRLLWAHPALTHRISAGIYAQAARLWVRGAPFHQHPTRRVSGTPWTRGSRS
jgi:uncharacterized protein